MKSFTLFTAVGLIIGPIFTIAALHQLGVNIDLTFETWLSVMWLTLLLNFITDESGKL